MAVVSGTTWACITDPGKIPVDTYGAGDIRIYAMNDSDSVIDITSATYNATLALTVTTSDGLRTGALRWLNETIYVKYATGTDDNGYTTYGDWASVSARIERQTQKVMDSQGVMVTSNAQICVSGDNAVGIMDRIKLSNDYSTAAEAHIIRVNTITDAAGNSELKVVFI